MRRNFIYKTFTPTIVGVLGFITPIFGAPNELENRDLKTAKPGRGRRIMKDLFLSRVGSVGNKPERARFNKSSAQKVVRGRWVISEEFLRRSRKILKLRNHPVLPTGPARDD